uniref:ADP-ribosylation factor-like protein 13B n=1 Tax=Macrostomum lignano TaxID=282301 RepID=A0A1I8IIK6_9PLAT
EITLAIFGIDNAGKTTTTKSIRGDSLEVCPTMGFDLIEFSLDSYNCMLLTPAMPIGWMRPGLLWAGLLQNELIQGKPVLLLANKQDSAEAMDEAEIVSSLRLSELACANRCPCRLERSVANIGTGTKMDKGIKTGLRWLLQYISMNWEELDARVQRDKAAKAAADAEEAAARKERVRRRREERERQEAAEAAAAGTAPLDAADKPEDDAASASVPAAAAAAADEDKDASDLRPKRRGGRLRQPSGVDSSKTADDNAKNQADSDTEEPASASAANRHRLNRRHRRRSSGGSGDFNEEDGKEEDYYSERRRRSRRHRRDVDDPTSAAAVAADDQPEENSSDRKPKQRSSSSGERSTAGKNRARRPGSAAAAAAPPVGLFEIGAGPKGRGDEAGGGSSRLSKPE